MLEALAPKKLVGVLEAAGVAGVEDDPKKFVGVAAVSASASRDAVVSSSLASPAGPYCIAQTQG